MTKILRKIAFIPARSGSKRFPNKNISILGDKPLIYWTVNAYLKSNFFDKVIFSSDSQEYFNILKLYIDNPNLEFHLRDSHAAGDKVKIFDYIKSNIRKWCNKDDIFALGLSTCPLRNSIHIKESADLYLKYNKSVFSACEYDFHVPFAFSLNDDNLEDWECLLDDSPLITGNTRSQDQKKYYHPNGGIYILKAEELINENIKTFYEKSIPYIMNKTDSIDIDTEKDLHIAKFYFDIKNNNF